MGPAFHSRAGAQIGQTAITVSGGERVSYLGSLHAQLGLLPLRATSCPWLGTNFMSSLFELKVSFNCARATPRVLVPGTLSSSCLSPIFPTALGAAYGTAKSGTGIAAMSVMRPELIMKSIIPVVMAGIIAIYGLVVAVLIANSLNDGISLYR